MKGCARTVLISSVVVAIGWPAVAQTDPAPPAAEAPTAIPAGTTAPSASAAPSEPSATPADAAPGEVPAASIPAPKVSLLKTTKTARYNKPLSFDPSESGVLLPPPEIEYDLTLNDGKTLQIGNVRLNDRTFVFVLRPLNALNAQVAALAGDTSATPVLAMVWPPTMLKSGTLEMISRTGQVLWKYDIAAEDVAAWKANLAKWKKTLKDRGESDKKLRGGVFATQFVIRDLEKKGAPFFSKPGETFRFCLTQAVDKMQTRLCSERFGTRRSRGKVVMGKVATSATPRIVVMNENGALKGSVPVAVDASAQFYADLAGGQSYEFLSLPPALNLVDLADTSKPGLLRVSGFGTAPTGPHAVLNPDRYGSLVKMLGFEPTIGDTRKFWAAGMKSQDPKLYFPGPGGGIFKQRFELSDIPRAAARPHFDRDTPKGTYSEEPKMFGRKQASSKVTSDQNSITLNPADPTLFTWNFRAKDKGVINRSEMTVTYDGKTYKGFAEIYRGYANELSGRFSGVAGSGGFVLVGEVAYNHWFESLFGWENTMFSKQRWGASAKYFKSMTQLSVGDDAKASLDVLAVDLKYRATPGLWTRDESVGGLLSYQTVTFDAVKAPMLGVGAFWARSMPRVFDGFFSWFPFMNHPKWVDMEFIYYVSSMKSDVTLNNTMALNFHGQVLWTESFFGEAGFGYKRYGFADKALNLDAKLDTFYGTMGLGLKF